MYVCVCNLESFIVREHVDRPGWLCYINVFCCNVNGTYDCVLTGAYVRDHIRPCDTVPT